MKAYRIISSEYKLNYPSIFLFVEGEYYGELSYPRLRKYPDNIDYWRTATCADSDRYFRVVEVEVTEEQIEKMKSLSQEIESYKGKIKEYSRWKAGMTKEEREEDEAYNRSVFEYNKPYEAAITEKMNEVESIIKSL